MNDVLIVGAGPVGLFLAAELQLQGCAPRVLERLAAPTGLSKALGVQGRGVDLLEARGLLPFFRAEAGAFPGGGLHFSGIPLPAPPRFLFILQARVEAILEAHLASLGVRVERACELVRFEEEPTRVRALVRTPDGERWLEARFLVGCDGGHSTVRALAGLEFPGTEPTMLLRLGDVRLPGAEITPQGVILPGGEKAPFGFGVPIDDGYFRVVTREPYPAGFDRGAPMTFDELAASVERTYGRAIPMTDARWLSRFTDAARQCARYGRGRVFVAGDAAHVHLPAGGPGISTGIHDAANLAWRLRAVLHGHARDTVLDGYTAERHAAGARVLQSTRAQTALMTRTAHTLALRELLAELFTRPEAARFMADLVHGDDVRYGDSPHPLVGRWMPAPVPMARARAVLLDASGRAAELAARFGDRLEVRAGSGDQSVLLRPDGYVAWAGAPDERDVDAALVTWLGAPSR